MSVHFKLGEIENYNGLVDKTELKALIIQYEFIDL